VCPGKQDQWGTYEHECEALFRFIGCDSISGVQAKLNARFITKDGKTFFQQTYLARRLQKR
tara:strand:+ start:98 stop:280 length:183 start_codon:yes stop_codon:yes gene_type:complete